MVGRSSSTLSRSSGAEPSRPTARQPERLQPLQSAGQIDLARMWKLVDRARGRLGQGAAERRGVTLLQDHPASAERGGAAKHRPDILGIGHLVQHHQEPGRRLGEFVERRRFEGRRFQRHALMDRPSGKALADRRRLGHLDDRRDVGPAGERAGAIGGDEQTLRERSGGIVERRLDRVPAPEPLPAILHATARRAPERRGRAAASPVVASMMGGHYKRASFFLSRVSPSTSPTGRGQAKPRRERGMTDPNARGGMSRVAKGADCKSAGVCLRRFESYFPHHAHSDRQTRV